MLGRLRSSFATKLLIGGIALTLLIVGSVGGYLLYSRGTQTRAGALSNSDNRVAVMREVLEQFTGAQAFSSATDLAVQPQLVSALERPDPAPAVASLFAGPAAVAPASEVVVITDSAGRPVFARAAADLGAVVVAPFAASSAIPAALRGATCGVSHQAGACGVELLGGSIPAYSVAVPVRADGQIVGAVAYVAPLAPQLRRFAQLFQFPAAFVPAGEPSLDVRESNGVAAVGSTPSQLTAGIAAHQDLVHATYTATIPGSGSIAVAGSYVAVDAPDGHTLAGYLGIEVPLSSFVGDQTTDEVTLALITVFVLLLLVLLILVFVELVVRRPIHRLERGVARIAGGDYASPVQLRSRDELGRLADGVNTMQDSIRRYTTEISEARQRLDSAVSRVSAVSRALTTTTGGFSALQREVVAAAAAIAGEGTSALLALRDGDTLTVRAVHPAGSEATLDGWHGTDRLLNGAVVRDAQPEGTLLAIPMFWQDAVVGALCVVSDRTHEEFAADEQDVLAVLANNAAVALENARLFEQERETVRRLRQLDAMKSDFLATVQHELRTPLTAIIGLADLLELCWGAWEDSAKLNALGDMQVAARNLYDIVETIIDFSAVDSETLDLHIGDISVAGGVQQAVALVGERYKDGVPVPVRCDVDAALRIRADEDRFTQVMRALIDNAVKFSDSRGAVTVTAAPGGEGGTVAITVADEGIGIAPDDLPRVFERFYQVDNTATRRYGGTGMGLALVKRLAEAHGATVSVESELGAGTRVVLRWPAAGDDGSGDGDAVTAAEPIADRVPAAAKSPVQ